jgi:hypothetical protein
MKIRRAKRVKHSVTSAHDEIYIAKSTIPGAGLGAFCSRDLAAGRPLGSYRGVAFDSKKQESSGYVMGRIDARDPTGVIEIDGKHMKPAVYSHYIRTHPNARGVYHGDTANWTRFVNDAGQPRANNLSFGGRSRFGQMLFYPRMRIPANTELTWRYGAQFWNSPN